MANYPRVIKNHLLHRDRSQTLCQLNSLSILADDKNTKNEITENYC